MKEISLNIALQEYYKEIVIPKKINTNKQINKNKINKWMKNKNRYWSIQILLIDKYILLKRWKSTKISVKKLGVSNKTINEHNIRRVTSKYDLKMWRLNIACVISNSELRAPSQVWKFPPRRPVAFQSLLPMAVCVI